MQESDSQLNAIAQVLDVVACSNTQQEKTLGIKACLQLLAELRDGGIESSELYYLLGYAWYLSPDSIERSKNIVSFLSRSLELNFEHHMAKVYLCHYFFDAGLYAEFLKHFQQVESYQLPKWRKLKLLEMKLISKSQLTVLDEQECDWYIQEYERANENDQPVINELFEFSQNTNSNLPEVLSQFVDKWSNFWNLKTN